MTTLLPQRPSLVSSPFSDRTRIPLRRTTRFGFSNPKPSLRGSITIARLGLGPDPFPDPEVFRDLLGRAEGFLYTVADAAVSSQPAAEAVGAVKQNEDWFSGIANYMESVLKVLRLDSVMAVSLGFCGELRRVGF